MRSSSRMASGTVRTRPARAEVVAATVALVGTAALTAGGGPETSPPDRPSPTNSPTAAATATRVSAITMASSGRIESSQYTSDDVKGSRGLQGCTLGEPQPQSVG